MNIIKLNVDGNTIFFNIVTGIQTREMPYDYSRATREQKRDALEKWRKIKYADGRKNSLYNNNQIPNEFLCPISEEIMEDPVLADDNHTYDRPNILRWLGEREMTFQDEGRYGYTDGSRERTGAPQRRSPITGGIISTFLSPNRALKNRIDDWKAGPPQFDEDMEGGSFDY
jgi:hypothetical protein